MSGPTTNDVGEISVSQGWLECREFELVLLGLGAGLAVTSGAVYLVRLFGGVLSSGFLAGHFAGSIGLVLLAPWIARKTHQWGHRLDARVFGA